MWRYNGKRRPEFAIAPGEGEESVWDYPRPPALSPDSRHIEVLWKNHTIAQTNSAIRLLETASAPGFYIPPGDVDTTVLKQSSRTTFCEWKGAAAYFDLIVENNSIPMVGWSYQNPNQSYLDLKDYISFYPGKVTCTVDGETVDPQPGSFYGGWVTDEIVGPIKGEPGTGGW